jgi:putative oxidoreductase
VIKIHNDHISKLIIRLSCGGMLLLHGLGSVRNGIDHVKRMVTSSGLPEFISYGNYVGEVVAPIFLIIGYKSRIAALVVALNMLMSILLGHRDIAFMRNDFGGWMIETNVFYMMTALAMFFSGSGKYSLSGGVGEWD